MVDGNVVQYCKIDKKKKEIIEEMEQKFLGALQSFYYDQSGSLKAQDFFSRVLNYSVVGCAFWLIRGYLQLPWLIIVIVFV